MGSSSIPFGFDQQALLRDNVTAAQFVNEEQLVPGTDNAFWPQAPGFIGPLQGQRWDRLYPYQLLLLAKEDTGYRRIQAFTLPIPPQELGIATNFAISTLVTQGGIVEEHGGAPLRDITLSGTTGVLPLRGAPDQGQSLGLDLSRAIFGGTVEQLGQLVAPVSQQVAPPNLVTDSDLAQGDYAGTGYFQWHLLRQFLEGYASLKRTREGRKYRLGFATWKDGDLVYLVTPQGLSLRRSSASPLEYGYSLGLKAWRRVALDGGVSEFKHTAVVRDPNRLSQMLNALDDLRRGLEKGRALLGTIRADAEHTVFAPLRSTTLFLKDLQGATITLSDLPQSLQVQLARNILELSQEAGADPLVPAATATAVASVGVRTGLAQDSRGRQQAGNLQQGLTGAEPGLAILQNPSEHYEFFHSIKPLQTNLNARQRAAIEAERTRVRLLRRSDFQRYRDNLMTFMADAADALGAGNQVFADTYARRDPPAAKTLSPESAEVLFQLNALALEYNRLAASQATDVDRVTAVEAVAGLARRSGIAFREPVSKFAVPFPMGHTLEQVSLMYLGTPDRWHEIAALNGLQEPYVDETGYDMALLTGAVGTEVIVQDASLLSLAQTVWLRGDTVRPEKRHVVALHPQGTQWAVVLDGEPTLSAYTVAAGAVLHAYLPNTVNGLQTLWIPSDSPPGQDLEPPGITGLDDLEALLQVGGVDLRLTPAQDLAVTPDGDCQLAVGLTNVVQRAYLGFAVPRRALLRHPDFGFGVRPGTSVADVTAQDVLASMRATFAQDPDFTGVEAATVTRTGPALDIRAALGVRGVNHLLPLSFLVPLRP